MEKRPGKAPAPLPNDVLAYGLTKPGHTSICIDTAVNAQGDGFIIVMEQNNDPSGWQRIPVQNWEVKGSMLVTKYLHELPREPVEDYGLCLYFVENDLFAEEPFRTAWLRSSLQNPTMTRRSDVKSRCGLALGNPESEQVTAPPATDQGAILRVCAAREVARLR